MQVSREQSANAIITGWLVFCSQCTSGIVMIANAALYMGRLLCHQVYVNCINLIESRQFISHSLNDNALERRRRYWFKIKAVY